jgi:hypothetical protein
VPGDDLRDASVFLFILFFILQRRHFHFLPLKMLFIFWRTVIKKVKSFRTSVSCKHFFKCDRPGRLGEMLKGFCFIVQREYNVVLFFFEVPGKFLTCT